MSQKFKTVDEMNEGDMVAGVVYAAAAEQIIRRAFETDCGDDYPGPTVIGYMVSVEDDSDELVVDGDCDDSCDCWGPGT